MAYHYIIGIRSYSLIALHQRKVIIMATKIRQGIASDGQRKSVVESNAEFRDGACSGYLTYYDDYQSKQITDIDVYNFLVQNITDMSGTHQFNAGYCTGWIEALIEDRQILYVPENGR